MENATLAIAIVSISVSMLTLGWTIYRDVVQKPRFRVSVGTKTIFGRQGISTGPDIHVDAVNLGPLPNRANTVFLRNSWFHRIVLRKHVLAALMPDHTHVAATPVNSRIEVGDTATFVFPIINNEIVAKKFAQIGVSDGYGRRHWAPTGQFTKLRKSIESELRNAD